MIHTRYSFIIASLAGLAIAAVLAALATGSANVGLAESLSALAVQR